MELAKEIDRITGEMNTPPTTHKELREEFMEWYKHNPDPFSSKAGKTLEETADWLLAKVGEAGSTVRREEISDEAFQDAVQFMRNVEIPRAIATAQHQWIERVRKEAHTKSYFYGSAQPPELAITLDDLNTLLTKMEKEV